MTIGLKTMLKIMFFTSVVYLFTVAEKQSHEDSSHFAGGAKNWWEVH
jgi:hypothetical protein